MGDSFNPGSGSSSQSKSKSRKRKRTCDDAEINTYLENRYHSLVPGPILTKKRRDLIKKVKSLIKATYSNSKIRVYGWAFAGTALISSDIDFVVYVETDSADSNSADSTINQIVNVLENAKFKDIQKREVHDRIGIFCYDEDQNKSKTYIDLTLNNRMARKASKLIRSVVDVNPSIKMLVVLVKEFSKCYNINDPKRGTLASVGYTYMVVFVLQLNNLLPRFINRDAVNELVALIGEADAYKVRFDESSQESGNTTTLQLLRTFFHYYNKEHDFNRNAISIIGGQVVSKQSLGWGGGGQKYTLSIVDPFGPENIGRTVSYQGMVQIKVAFDKAESILAGSKPHDLFRPVNQNISEVK